MRLRTRIFLAVLLLASAVFFPLFLEVNAEVAAGVQAAASSELERAAYLVASEVGDLPFSDSVADALGPRVGARVSLIDRSGRVLGDSEVPARRLRELDDHRSRPEVAAALAGEAASSTRASRTIARLLLYVAVPHPQGAVRLAVPAQAGESSVARVRRLIILAWAMALLLGLAVGAWIEARLQASVTATADALDRVAAGDVDTPHAGAEGFEELARAFERMRGGVRERLGALRSDREDLRALFEGLEDGLAVVSSEGIVLGANRAFSALAGQEGTKGERFTALFRDPRITGPVGRALQGSFETNEVAVGDRTLLLSARPHRGGALVVLRDLTQIRQLEEVRREFVANASHELKTPLTSIAGFAEAVAAGDLTTERSLEFGQRIVDNAQRMRRLVDDLLDLAMFESGNWVPEAELLEVGSLARRVWAELGGHARSMRLELVLPERPPPVIRADREAAEQILRNLFDNAIRFSPRDSAVHLEAEPEGAMLRVTVRDSGSGIPWAHQARVFERFYRVDPARSRAEGGTGLGLSIVKHLVTSHGGRVGVESEVGVGTRVWFTLPLADDTPTEEPGARSVRSA